MQPTPSDFFSILRQSVDTDALNAGTTLAAHGALRDGLSYRCGTSPPRRVFVGYVRGHETDVVSIDVDESGHTRAQCSCVRANSLGRGRIWCRHIVAVLLEIDQRPGGLGSGGPGSGWPGLRAIRKVDEPPRLTNLEATQHALPSRAPAPRRTVMNDAWRAGGPTFAPGLPAPIVYAVSARHHGLPIFSVYQCRTGASEDPNETFLEYVPPTEIRNLLGDALDTSFLLDVGTFANSGWMAADRMATLLVRLALSGRLHWRFGDPHNVDRHELGPALALHGPKDFRLELHVMLDDNGSRAWFRCAGPNGACVDIRTPPSLVLQGGVVIVDGSVLDLREATESRDRGRSTHNNAREAVMRLVRAGERRFGVPETAEVLEQLRNGVLARDEFHISADLPLILDPRIGMSFFESDATPVLRVHPSRGDRKTIDLQPLARYVDPFDPSHVVFRDLSNRRVLDPDDAKIVRVPRVERQTESEITTRMQDAVEKVGGTVATRWRIPRTALPDLIARLARERIAVDVANTRLRRATRWTARVASGINWFDLDGTVETDEGSLPLRALVDAARRHPESTDVLTLADGGALAVPLDLRAILRRLATLLPPDGDGEQMRFSRSAGPLLDAILADAPHRNADPEFESYVKRLSEKHTLRAGQVPTGFIGTLRDYQAVGLEWLHEQCELGLGACLADEMGLGKTVQLLALLARRAAPPVASAQRRRTSRVGAPTALRERPPSLIVVPRSLVRNWIDEARRFTPHLRVEDLSTGDRSYDDLPRRCDVALITYGIVLRDIEKLRALHFDLVILDEAQAIKNAAARTSKAVKCLQANHRVAVTGTPIENHLGELWSLIEFVNPPLEHFCRRLVRDETPESLAIARRAVAPFILRRSKREVANDLPDRIEQTLTCAMTEDQERHYRALHEHVRFEVKNIVTRIGFDRARLRIFEALLRLRQVACHPALADRRRRGAGSGKFEALVPILESSVAEQRKTLVFSQFTSLLALLRLELDDRNIAYEYLDGTTVDRAERVQRFATSDTCMVFLMSLKAGGVGLNLQAAERVVLLDPWWNPAVEAQAIDRAHRIGQTRVVHAMRLISEGTIEERVLELQRRKREVFDAIFGDERPTTPQASTVTEEDIHWLLSDTRAVADIEPTSVATARTPPLMRPLFGASTQSASVTGSDVSSDSTIA